MKTRTRRRIHAALAAAVVAVPSPAHAQSPPVQAFVHEAEDAEMLGDGGIAAAAEHPDFTGSGYVRFVADSGDAVRWTITAAHAGPHEIRFRYALGGSARPLRIEVNGEVVAASLDFSDTGGWDSWSHTVTLIVPLNMGTNTIAAISTGSGGGNLDHLEIYGPPPPPAGAIVLFDGTPESLASHWKRLSDGTPPHWLVIDGAVAAPTSGDIVTQIGFKDFDLHVEWLSPPGGSGPSAGNSGVKLQTFYEIQILNSLYRGLDGAGSIYLVRAPDANVSLGAGTWQSYDVRFTAARWSEGVKVSHVRATVRWNGILIHDDVAIPASTGASVREIPGLHPVLLQAHSTSASGPVLFRNVWIAPVDTFQQRWDAWADDSGLGIDDLHPRADPDLDGLPNLWEYATGGNPAVADAHVERRTPEMEIVTVDDRRHVQFSFLRRTDWEERGLHFTIETSATMAPGSWTRRAASLSGPPEATGDGITERCILRALNPLSDGAPRLFARLRAQILD